MAHQAHNIPWNLLASNFRWSTITHQGQKVTNLHPRMKPNQGKEITYFINAFIRTVDEHSVCERRKYPDVYEPVDPSEVILDEATVRKITPTVRRWRSYGFDGRCPSGICQVWKGEECQCNPIPDEERKASAFLRPHGTRHCYGFLHENHEAFFNVEVVKTLLLYGEMDTILRACALPGVELGRWWHDGECQCADYVLGWDQVCIKALRAYICLNMTYCFPEIWDSDRDPEMDYRNSKFYQFTLRTCTGNGQKSEVTTYPHRQFFGIGDKQFRGEYGTPHIRDTHWLRWVDEKLHLGRRRYYIRKPTHYGKVPIDQFLALENESFEAHQPGLSDVVLVRDYLYRKGLPAELVLTIMEFAGYETFGRLDEPHDPFHPSNREELAQYLTYCWRLLVYCDMMAKALGMTLPWEEIIGDCIADFWSDHCYGRGRFFWYKMDEYNCPIHKVFIKP